jgi:hypothetical protein
MGCRCIRAESRAGQRHNNGWQEVTIVTCGFPEHPSLAGAGWARSGKGRHVRLSWGTPVGLTALMVVLGGSVVPAAAAEHAIRPTGSLAAGGTQGRLSLTEVTLITGDRIRVTTGPGGLQSAAVEPRSARPGVSYDERTIPGPGRSRDVLVVPSDAAGLVGSGVLGESLFDVSALVRDRYTDAQITALPLIFTYRRPA